MTLIIIEFVIVLVGLAVTAVLFYRIPTLPVVNGNLLNYPTISVIIPARNEEHNLPLLLADLSAQTLPNLEIICIDDESEDSTGQIALANGVKLITLKSKPEGWTGKSWACQNGADAAKGELLLFLDADVRLGPDGMIKKVGVGVKEVISLYKESFSKPSFVLDEKLLKVSLPLPLFETDSLPTNEQLIVTLLQKKTQLTRAHFETLTGFHTSKVLRILNSLIEKSIVTLEGKGPSSTYSLR